jgi:hypothetical protein
MPTFSFSWTNLLIVCMKLYEKKKLTLPWWGSGMSATRLEYAGMHSDRHNSNAPVGSVGLALSSPSSFQTVHCSFWDISLYTSGDL